MSAMSAIFFPVKDISPNMPPWWTTVHLLRLWTLPNDQDHSRVVCVQMVFIDSEGSKIEGSISQDVVRMKRLVLAEGHKYDLQRAVVVPNEGQVRTTRHPFKLVFDMYSSIVLVERFPLITYGLSNMVGLMTSISCERNYIKLDKHVKAVFLELTNPTGKTECVLYDNHVDDILHFLRHHGSVTPIIVVQFARIASSGVVAFGESAIEGCGNITRLLFNPFILEVFEMKK
ncbi:Nucleic acid-binding, OB-fold, partial [Sesbania bispinosa]